MRRCGLVLFILGLALPAPGPAVAGPLDDPHVGGIGFSGPTTGDLSAVFWNPAALALVEGHQVMLVGSVRQTTTTVGRSAIDPATGAPGGSRALPSATGRGLYQPVSWPLGPGHFAAVGVDLGSRFSFAIASYVPFVERVKFSPSRDGALPTRYHATEVDLRSSAVVPALAVRLGPRLSLGVSPGFLFSTGRFVVDEDTALGAGAAGLLADCGGNPCGVENPAAAARYDLASGFGAFDSAPSFTLGGGLHYRFDTWDLGLAYSSHPLNRAGSDVELDAPKSRLTPPPRAGANALPCPAGRTDDCVFGHIAYDLPDTIIAGATWHTTPAWDLTGIARLTIWSRHDSIALRVVGPAGTDLSALGVPESVVLHRGFQDSWDVRLRATRALLDSGRLRLAATLRFETSAVTPARLAPAAVDGFKIEPSLAVAARFGRLGVAAGYAFTFVPEVNTGASAFDPRNAVACQGAGGDLGSGACRARLAGTARPTAAGRYGQHSHTASLALTAGF